MIVIPPSTCVRDLLHRAVRGATLAAIDLEPRQPRREAGEHREL
jgi:hypothetical protein